MVSRLNLASTPRGSRARICLVERDQVIDALLAEITGLANREILLPAPCFRPALPASRPADRARTRTAPRPRGRDRPLVRVHAAHIARRVVYLAGPAHDGPLCSLMT